MALDLLHEKGTPLEKQVFTWRDLAPHPYSKLDDDAFTRVRVILMNGIEAGTIRFSHGAASMVNGELRQQLALTRRIDHMQQVMVNWLNPADQTPLETTIGYEQVAIEVTASVAQHEPDPYLAQVYRFGMLEDFDHLYRFSALLDRLEGKDPNNLLQSYTDIAPGRPTVVEHRHPLDDLRRPYDRETASPISKLNALTILSAEHQTRDYYMNIAPVYADPVARQLYAEISAIEEQHVTQYGSLIDPEESILEKWLLYEANEVYNYWSCMQQESNPRIKAIWERFVDYELGQMHHVASLLEKHQGREAAELLPETLPEPIGFHAHRDFVRQVLADEVDLRANGVDIVPLDQEHGRSLAVRDQLNSEGSPSEAAASGYCWEPGTELANVVRMRKSS
jgi:hypothetical protein